MHDINEIIINRGYIVLFSFLILYVLLYRSFLSSRSVSVRVFVSLSIYQTFYLKQQITTTTTIFFRRRSHQSSRYCRRTITSIRRCTLEWCSVITVQGCWSSSYLFPLFFFCLCERTHARLFSAQSSLAYVFDISGEDEETLLQSS
jgi:hypothetical protein